MRLTVVIAILAIGAGSARAQLISPGKLSEGHASLDGDDNCTACHSEGSKVVADKCLKCHELLARQVRAQQGLHGGAYRGKPCADCHVEHNGRSYKLIRWPGGKMEKLDHRQAGWPLEGDHALQGCLKCHTRKNTVGRPSFLGLSTACGGCHRDPHAGRFGSSCLTCHGQSEWKVPVGRLSGFDHARTRYPLAGKHAQVACAKCHQDPPRWKGIEFDRCDRCHQDPHRGEFKQACSSCHTEAGWDQASSRFRREHPGLSLAGGHRRVACKACHDRGSAKPPSKGKECAGCHPPVHEARFGRRCERCHGSIQWLGLPRALGLEAHEKTAYALTGRHRDTACERCHPASKPPARRFRQLVFDRCGACHQDRHAGEFAARKGGGECAACHSTDGFAPSSFGIAAHGQTRFALEGRHQAVACASCHPGKRPRTDFRVAKQTCADCHANPHGEQFAGEMRRGGCASCHAPSGWGEPRIDHSTWPLTGAHGRTACARCHGAVKKGGAAEYRGVPRDCEGCHEDIHAGQFRASDPVRRCTDCHATERFSLPDFDHKDTAGYALEGRHRRVDCARCHPREELAGGTRAVRWRLGYRQCRDCHANPHREGS